MLIQRITKEIAWIVDAITNGSDCEDIIRNDFKIKNSINSHIIFKGDNKEIEKHIPLLKACGIAAGIDSLEIYLAFEEFFSLEKSSLERTASIGLTDLEKIGNHGFDVKTSFRGS